MHRGFCCPSVAVLTARLWLPLSAACANLSCKLCRQASLLTACLLCYVSSTWGCVSSCVCSLSSACVSVRANLRTFLHLCISRLGYIIMIFHVSRIDSGAERERQTHVLHTLVQSWRERMQDRLDGSSDSKPWYAEKGLWGEETRPQKAL